MAEQRTLNPCAWVRIPPYPPNINHKKVLDNGPLNDIMDDERRALMAWFAYLIGIVLMAADIPYGGLVFVFGMLIHWKFWIISIPAGLLAFLVGAGWQKPSL